MNVKLLHIDDCPNWRNTEADLVRMQPEYGFDLVVTRVGSPEEAEWLRFLGSPTVLVDGLDPFAHPDAPVGMSCRLYRTADGLAGAPTEAMLRQALAAAGSL